tara:strand:+ start:332 stop:547 length:216 start_codon:yes stop_codon:yes gene_type:complete
MDNTTWSLGDRFTSNIKLNIGNDKTVFHIKQQENGYRYKVYYTDGLLEMFVLMETPFLTDNFNNGNFTAKH